MIIPEDLTEFLKWVKYRTEKKWSHGPQTAEESCVCDKHDSFWGAKWVKGFSEDDIINCENKWNIKFPSDYKKILTNFNSSA